MAVHSTLPVRLCRMLGPHNMPPGQRPSPLRRIAKRDSAIFGTVVSGAFGVFFSYLWIKDAIQQHWGVLRWMGLVWFLALTVGPCSLMVYMMMFDKDD